MVLKRLRAYSAIFLAGFMVLGGCSAKTNKEVKSGASETAASALTEENMDNSRTEDMIDPDQKNEENQDQKNEQNQENDGDQDLKNNAGTGLPSAEELKAGWYDTHFYPLYQGSEYWQKYNMDETLDILNPPADLLESMSTEKLAELMQKYPCLSQITSYYGEDGMPDYGMMFSFLECQSDIFNELMRRDDGALSLMKAYQNSGVDAEWLLNDNAIWESVDETYRYYAEIFGAQFIRYYAERFTDEERELADQIIEEKKKIYDQVPNSFEIFNMEN